MKETNPKENLFLLGQTSAVIDSREQLEVCGRGEKGSGKKCSLQDTEDFTQHLYHQ